MGRTTKGRFAILMSRSLTMDADFLRERAPYFLEIARAARAAGLEPFFVSPLDITYRSKRAVMHTADMKRVSAPLPRLVYKTHSTLYAPGERNTGINRLARSGKVRLFNSRPFDRLLRDKYRTYWALKKHPEIRPFLPRLRILSKVPMRELLASHADWVIKPRYGSRGRDVKLVSDLTRAEIRAAYERPRSWIIQRRVDGCLIGRRMFDLRFGLIVNRANDFEHAYAFARIARYRSMVTNICQGGMCRPVSEAARSAGRKGVRRAEKLAPVIASRLQDASWYGSLCSVDFLIDKQGKPWFIEANADPVWDQMYEKIGIRRKRVMKLLLARIEQLARRHPGLPRRAA